eukprot:TRINITY_DN1003_c0_g1_i1.p1 TRINITY_DN1003_c0_g1~~TRINITY_DN1003_c0_g1_i1.p1  ORF type:complete len:130 (-),score=28.64 TRINITY_DN1003_c0_g1_i1:56-445(-)
MSGKGKGKAGGSKGGKGKGEDSGDLGSAVKVKVRHILCEKQVKLMEAIKHLNGYTEGETSYPPKKFNQVAELFSEDKARDGGNLGWITRQSVEGVFAEVAFSTPVGQVSAPFKGRHGWHILTVEGRANS